MMNSRKKIVIAAMLAAVLALTGCNTDNERPSAFSNDDGYSSVSSDSTVSTVSSASSVSDVPAVESTVVSEVSESEPIETTTSVSMSGTESKGPETSEPESDSNSSNNWLAELSKYSGSSSNSWLDIPKTDDDQSVGYKIGPAPEEEAVDALIDELDLNDDKKSDMEKLCILGKWFSDNTEYDHELVSSPTGESAVSYLLTKHTGICHAYAKAACLILSECGIDTLYCSGSCMNHGLSHAWNAVKIDGQWTYTDFVGGPDNLILGSGRHGLPHTVITHYLSLNGYGYSGEIPDISEVSDELRLYDFDGNEFEVHEEADGFSYVDSSGNSRKCVF